MLNPVPDLDRIRFLSQGNVGVDHLRGRCKVGIQVRCHVLGHIGNAQAGAQNKDRMHRNHRQANHRQDLRGAMAQPIHGHAGQRVDHEDVAVPQQEPVQEAEPQEPKGSAKEHPCGFGASAFQVGREQEDARPVQRREDGHELLVRKKVREDPNPLLKALE